MSWTNCIDCGKNLDSDAQPEVFRSVGKGSVALCDSCFGPVSECWNCHYLRLTPRQQHHAEHYPEYMQTGMCDLIRDEEFVELIAIRDVPEIDVVNYDFEVISTWRCNEWSAKTVK